MAPEQRYLFDPAKQAPAIGRKCLFFGEPTGDRTQDLRIKSPVLYQLSYRLYRGVYLIKNKRFAYPSQDYYPTRQLLFYD